MMTIGFPVIHRILTCCCLELTLCCLSVAGLAGQEGAHDVQVLLVSRTLWSGYLDALVKSHDPFSFVLAPDGQGFLYYQGAPWPRLLYRPLADRDAQPIMVAPAVPLVSAAPCFSPSGDAIYFTVVGGVETLPAPGDRDPISLYVARATFPGRELERLHPGLGAPEGTFSVLLDAHPAGETLLVGAGSGLRGVDLGRADVSLDLLEWSLSGRRAVPLGFKVNGRSLVRYSRDGASIEYTLDDGDGSIHLYTRATGRHRRTERRRSHLAARAGDLDVATFQVPHRGSFGWDGFRHCEIHDPRRATRSLLELSPQVAARVGGEPGATRSPTPLPVSFRRGRVLLCGGFEDRWYLAVGEIEQRENLVAGVASRTSALSLDSRFFEESILARYEPAAGELLGGLRQSLRTPSAEVVAAVRAELRLETGTNLGGGKEIMRILERGDGLFRAERVYIDLRPPETSEEETDGSEEDGSGKETEADAPPDSLSQIFAFDGEKCWMKTADGEYRRLDTARLAMEINAASVFRLFFDPAGLKDANLRFGKPDGLPVGEKGQALWTIPYSYPDGYSGELVVRRSEDGVLPVSWRSPLLFRRHGLRRALGDLPEKKEIRLEGWQVLKGWRVPRRLRFDSGFRPYVLEIETIDFPENLDPGLFRMPGEGGSRVSR